MLLWLLNILAVIFSNNLFPIFKQSVRNKMAVHNAAGNPATYPASTYTPSTEWSVSFGRELALRTTTKIPTLLILSPEIFISSNTRHIIR
jgi:hypothetical protein